MAIAGIPTNLVAQQADGVVYLTWDLIAGATTYTVQRSADQVTYTTIGTSAVNDYTDSSASVGVQYWYQVASTNGSGTSAYSSTSTVVPALPGKMSLYEVRLRAQQRADRVNSQFVTTEEWNSYINQSYFELYDILVTAYEDYYIKAPYHFLTTGAQQYDLPDDFYKLAGVDLGITPNQNAWVTLKKFNFIARNRFIFPQLNATYLGFSQPQYRLMGNTLFFIPTPSAGQMIQLWYVPRLTALLKDTDMLDGISGWTEYVITDAAIKALQKEESDVSVLAAQKMGLIKRIEESSQGRDEGQADTVSDTRGMSGRSGMYGLPNGDGGFGGI